MSELINGFVCVAELQVTRAGETEPEPEIVTDPEEDQ